MLKKYKPTTCFAPKPLDSILEAVFTVSPKRQYRGIVRPTTPAQTGPECRPESNSYYVFEACM